MSTRQGLNHLTLRSSRNRKQFKDDFEALYKDDYEYFIKTTTKIFNALACDLLSDTLESRSTSASERIEAQTHQGITVLKDTPTNLHLHRRLRGSIVIVVVVVYITR